MDGILTSPPDLSGWPSKLDAARLLGIGERTLDRQIARTGAPEIRMRPRNNGRKPEPVCNPQDLERLVAERKRAVLMSPEFSSAVALAHPVDDGPAISRVMSAVAKILGPSLEAVTARPLWLTLQQAAGYTGLSMALLVRLAQGGAVDAVKDNGWKFRRAALDVLELPGFDDVDSE
jgi:hypothetical protein